MNRYGKAFWITLLVKQNKYHTHSVLGHTFKVVYHLIKKGRYDMVMAGFLHDIAKPLAAYQDDGDKITGEYSFTNHEAMGYHVIKNWPVAKRTKDLVRYHYLIRGMYKAKQKGKLNKYKRQKRLWDSLDDTMRADLGVFLACDDLGKKKGF